MTESGELSLTPSDFNPFTGDMTGKVLLGRYRIVRQLAAGGMGIVYLARAEGAAGFAKPVVLKLILPNYSSNEHFAGMFIREAKILATLQHPGIVNVIDFAQEKDCYVMVLEYVHGYHLGEWKRYRDSQNRTIPAAVAIKIMIDVLDALHYAHNLTRRDGALLNVIHRDISPSNILLDTDGRARVVDFGIAVMGENSEVYKTQTESSFKGKLSYAAPELFANSPASVQSDVYACGVVLHEILLGYNDFKGAGYGPTLGRVLTHQPAPVSQHRVDVPSQIDMVLRKALYKNPEKRYQTAQAFAADLRKVSPLEGQKAAAMLHRMVSDDFDEEMATFLGVESLHRRDKAWRHPSQAPPSSYTYAQQPETLAMRPIPEGTLTVSTPGTRHGTFVSKGVWLAALVLAAAVVAVVITLVLTRGSPPVEQKFLIVQSPVADPEPTPDTEAVNVGQAPAVDKAGVAHERPGADSTSQPREAPPEKGDAKRKNRPVPRAQSDVEELTRAFRKQKSKIRRCFDIHTFDLEGRPEISFSFEIAASGRVRRAQLSPASLVSTTLGKCLKSVAVNTEFPRLGRPASFRIPVKAWRGQQ